MQADGDRDKSPPVGGGTEPAHALGVQSSFSGRTWTFQNIDESSAKELEYAGLSAPLSGLVSARGVTKETLAEFLDPKLKSLLPDPNGFRRLCLRARLDDRSI